MASNQEPLFHSIAYQTNGSSNNSKTQNDSSSVLLIHRHSLNVDSNPNNSAKPQRPRSATRTQQFSFNINEQSSRLKLWAIIILIVSVAEINFTLSLRLYYSTYKDQFNSVSDPNPYIGTKLYDILSLVSNSFLFAAAAFILLGISKYFIAKVLTSILLITGACVHLSHCIYGLYAYPQMQTIQFSAIRHSLVLH